VAVLGSPGQLVTDKNEARCEKVYWGREGFNRCVRSVQPAVVQERL